MQRGSPSANRVMDDKMKKLRVVEEGKQFEVYLKFALTEVVPHVPQPLLIGVSYAGSFTAARAVHAALYQHMPIEIVDEDTGNITTVRPNGMYRRVETVDGKVTHHTLLPRSSSDEDYQLALNDMVKHGSDRYPERIVIAPQGNVIEVAGQFISETFGLPRTTEWAKNYLTILGIENCKKINVITTDLAGEWKNINAVKVMSMKEEDVLEKINESIKNNVLNPRSTSIMGEGDFKEDMTTEAYLKENAELLAKKLDAFMKPLTDGSILSPFIGELNRISLPAQAKASMGALEVLKHKKGVFLVGDMGSGKTQQALTAVYTYARQREQSGATDGISVMIIAPSNVVPKWATSEIPKVIKKNKHSVRIISSTDEALSYVREVKNGASVPKGKIEFVLVSTDRMKLASQGYVLGAKWDSKHYVWRSPNTGQPLVKPTKKKEESVEDAIAGWSDAIDKPSNPPTPAEFLKAKADGTLLPNGLPMNYVKKWKPDVRNFQDDYEQEKNHRSLARPARKNWGETKGGSRWMIADIFQKHLRNHFHMGIFDEIHQMKASDSGRGVALAKILKSCRKYLFLTGTLTNGASTSIQSLLWRAFPGELLKDGINYRTSKEQWAQRYGVLERIVTRSDGDKNVGTNTNRKKDTVIVKEKPGISPRLISNYLLDKCVFVELADLQVPLVELEEIPVVVQLDDDHLEEYKALHSDLYNTSVSLQREIGSAAWSMFNPTTLNYADQPQLGAEVEYKDRDGLLLDTVKAVAFPKDYVTAKERKMLKNVEKELKENRRCILFTHFSGNYQTNERLKTLLEDKGINCEIMNDSVSVENRFDWLEAQAQAGTEILIMNMRLVEVGLDLMEFPTIMFYQMNDDINVVRQASRRAWRLGQHRICRVYYFFADKTNQMVQFQRLMSRRVAAMIVEGRIERSDDLAKYADTSSNGMVADLSKTLSSVELANAWKSAAAKDVDAGLEIVSEANFQQRVDQAFKELTAKTIEICGFQPTEEDNLDMDAFEDAMTEFDLLEQAFQQFEEMMAEKKEVPVKTDELKVIRQKRKIERTEEVITGTEQLDLFSLLG
jgi:SNF2 family DNA or RNA helicase